MSLGTLIKLRMIKNLTKIQPKANLELIKTFKKKINPFKSFFDPFLHSRSFEKLSLAVKALFCRNFESFSLSKYDWFFLLPLL